MIIINEDVLWPEPLVIDTNTTTIETTFDYQIASNTTTIETTFDYQIASDTTTIETTFDYQIASLSSSPSSSLPSSPSSSSSPSSPSNMSSSSVSILTTSTSMSTTLSNQNHFPLLKWSVRIIGGLLIVVGGIGNTLSALTLSRKKLRAQVTSIYLIALALSDLGTKYSLFHSLSLYFHLV
jgi:hypothetical protein